MDAEDRTVIVLKVGSESNVPVGPVGPVGPPYAPVAPVDPVGPVGPEVSSRIKLTIFEPRFLLKTCRE
uniref:Uncharacterized protein n=1 Tax=viral metagenome TaxID=1070528 RepID=A0A6C0H502_9ZZZZ